MISLKNRQYLLYSLNAITGIIFCLSAVLKLISIDTFELYIYSFQFVNLSLSALAARLIICGEIILGVGLIINIYPKFFRIISILTLALFSLFLIYLLITQGNNDNCHCFGDLVELNPLPSFFKNIALIIILILTKNIKSFKIPYKKLISVCLIIIPFIVVFATNPPDNWFTRNNTDYNEKALFEFIESNQTINNESDTQILCFFGLGCKYCELAAKKLYLIEQNNPQVKMNIVGVFWGKEEKLEPFEKETELNYSSVHIINPVVFLDITEGSMPVILILKNGKVSDSFSYRNLHEKDLLQSLH